MIKLGAFKVFCPNEFPGKKQVDAETNEVYLCLITKDQKEFLRT